MVQCFNDVTSCNANSNVMMITAGQCCNSTGGSSRHIRVVFPVNQVFCGSCFGELHKYNYQNLKNMKSTKWCKGLSLHAEKRKKTIKVQL